MTVDISPETQRKLDQRLATGRYRSPDELLQDAFEALDERDQWLIDLRESLAEMESGQTVPADDVFEEIRRERGWARAS